MSNASIIVQNDDKSLIGEGFNNFAHTKVETMEVGSFKVIYVYDVIDPETGETLNHYKGRLKVGDATLNTSLTIEELLASCDNDNQIYRSEAISNAAKKRIDEQTKTADVSYQLYDAFLAVKANPNLPDAWESFRDYRVHDVLMRSGYKKSFSRSDKKSGEWFETDLDTVLAATRALINGKSSISNETVTPELTLRPEQEEAIKKTKKVFKDGSFEEPKIFLWNAIMRFGKTFTAYSLVKDLEQDIKKVLVLTHYPVVVDGWAKDFSYVFDKDSGWTFASKKMSEKWDSVKNSDKFFYFASIQDLRGSFNETDEGEDLDLTESELVNLFSKNEEVFGTDWDLVINDEAHSGVKTDLAQRMFSNIRSRYELKLSGTPFNIIDDYESNQVYTWSYVDEQKAKEKWLEDNPEDSNPYASNTEIELRTYSITDVFKNYPEVAAIQNNIYFNFRKFFAVDTHRTETFYDDFQKREVTYHPFQNKGAIGLLLDLMTNTNGSRGTLDPLTGQLVNEKPSLFPYANPKAWIDFADTFWILPTIHATKALHALLLEHPAFDGVGVVNASGNNDSGDPLDDVRKAIKTHKKTITLSIGKLTTGTTVPEWTAVFMLSNTKSAISYMQTIFRAKSSGSLRDGRVKEKAYVFDFAPDRCLEVIVEAGKNSAKATIKEENLKLNVLQEDDKEREFIDELLTYLPIVSYNGATFETADSRSIMTQLNRIFIEDTVRSGFFSLKLFNKEELGKVPEDELGLFKDLGLGVGASKATEGKKLDLKTSEIAANLRKKAQLDQFKDDNPGLFPIPDRGATDEQKEYVDELSKVDKKLAENKKQMTLILRGVAVRMPLMVLAMDQVKLTGNEYYDSVITIDNFASLVDDQSWEEFMPKGFYKTRAQAIEAGNGEEKPSWETLKKYFNKKVFEGSVVALQTQINRIHDITQIPLEHKPLYLAQVFSNMVNPDKETILTPFRVVNLQYISTLGGLQWVDMEDKVRVKRILETTNDTGAFERSAPVRVSLDEAIEGIENETLELALEWFTSDVDPNEDDDEGFWEDWNTTILDINSKTALYPLFAAASRYYAEKKHQARRYQGKRVANQYSSLTENEKLAQDLNLWKDIIENQIFVNCRVPYSARIAERVLRGYSKEIAVNTSVIDVIAIHRKLRLLGLYDKISKKQSRGPDDVWQWIFNRNTLKRFKKDKYDKIMCIAEERAAQVEHLKTGQDLALFLDVLESDCDSFSATVSNPPYQIQVGGTKYSVYQNFFLVATAISTSAVFIFPIGWQKSSGAGTGSANDPKMREDPRLVSIDNYFEDRDSPIIVFPNTGTGGVNIVYWNSNHNNNFLVNYYQYGEFIEKRNLATHTDMASKTIEIMSKISIWTDRHSKYQMSNFLTSKVPFGLRTYILTGTERPEYSYVNNDGIGIKFLGKNKTKNIYSWIKEDAPFLKLENLQKWKVAWSRTGPSVQYRTVEIIPPGVIFAEQWMGTFFDTEQEALNFVSYFQTSFYRFILSEKSVSPTVGGRSLHELVPNLKSFINPRTNLIGWQSTWTDEDLKVIFKDYLDDTDWEYIEKVVLDSDPAGNKRLK